MVRRLTATPVIISLIALLLQGTATAAPRPFEGTVIMARGGSQPLYLWNATPYVAHLVSDKILGDDGMRELEASAVAALADKAKGSSAAKVAIRVVYAKTGAVSAAYGTPTFAGIENVLTLTVERGTLEKDLSSWQATLEKGKTPAGVRIDIAGALPPR